MREPRHLKGKVMNRNVQKAPRPCARTLSRRMTGKRCALMLAMGVFCASTHAATFIESGAKLTVTYTASEQLTLVNNGTSLTVTSSAIFSGINTANVTGNGTAALTVTGAGIATFSSGIVFDSTNASGTTFVFGSSSGAYSDPITIANAGSVSQTGAQAS